jgi:peptidoglycan/xylan/chitin deacetylase (PgdA/CDA1 family)
MRVVSLSQLIEYIESGADLPDKVVSITFDDGYLDFYTKAYPILKEYGVPCTLFPITSLLDSGGSKWEDLLAYMINKSKADKLKINLDGKMEIYDISSQLVKLDVIRRLNAKLVSLSEKAKRKVLSDIELQTGFSDQKIQVTITWNELEILKRNNLIDIGCHTHTHQRLSGLSLNEAIEEISTSKEKLEKFLGKPCYNFAYPIGKRRDFNKPLKDLLKSMGFKAACTTIPGTVSKNTDLYELRRISVPNNASYIFKCSLIGIALQRG